MAEAAHSLREYAAGLTFQAPCLPLYADKTCKPYTVKDAAELLGEQVESPVRWTQLIRTMALAAAASGADGLMIEVHNDPSHALSDGAQSLTPEAFTDVSAAVYAVLPHACLYNHGKVV